MPLSANVTVTPQPVQPGEPMTVNLAIDGAVGPLVITATLNGEPVTLDRGNTALTAPSSAGVHTLLVEVVDGPERVSVERRIAVGVDLDVDAPEVRIATPREGPNDELVVITAPTAVRGTVSDANLERWRLSLASHDGTASQVHTLAEGTAAVSNGALGTLDPTLLPNGLYTLLLEGLDQYGNQSQDRVLVSIEGAMKLGHFAISFVDLEVPVAGLPITVTRTYDSRVRSQNQDFGYGWSVDYRSIRLQEARRPGFGWSVMVYPTGPFGLLPKYCIEAGLGNVVNVVLPDGEVERFRAVAYPECADTAEGEALPSTVELRFRAMPGTTGKLEPLDHASAMLLGHNLADPDSPGSPLDPDRYRYTNAEGQEFTLDQGFTVRQIHERAGGNTVSFNRNGVIHSAGPSITFVRDAHDRITQVIAPDESVIDYEYDAAGNLAAVVDAEQNRTEFTYLDGHYLQDIIDPRGVRVSRQEYDDDGRLVAIIDADGKRIEYNRDIDGRLEQVTDRRGHTTTYIYNQRGDVLVETNGEGESTTRSYDDNGNTLSETNDLGHTQRWTYDARGNVLTETDGENGVTRHTYGPFNQLETTVDAESRPVAEYVFRNTTIGGAPVYPGPLVRLRDAAQADTTFGYDSATGELDELVGPDGARTRYEYDTHGHKTAEIDATGQRTDYINDALGRVIEERRQRTRADGSLEILLTVYTRDGNGNVTAIQHPDGSSTTTTYDGNGKPVRECDALIRCTETRYDARGNVDRITYPDGRTEHKTYDENGNLASETDRNGHTTRYRYDRANRLVETMHPDDTSDSDDDNPRSRTVYDRAGRVAQSIDPTGHVTAYQYDAAGRRIQTMAATADGPAITTTEYDRSGRRTATVDPLGRRTEYRYDAVGRLTETLGDDGSTVRREYDEAGRKTAEVNAEGERSEYGYDALGRLNEVRQFLDGRTLRTRYRYDEQGNKTEQIDALGRTTRWEYDAMGRETARILPGGQREEKVYNAGGELIGHTDFNGKTTTYGYDPVGQLIRTDYADGRIETFAFDAAGNRTSMSSTEGTTTWVYDARNRVVRETQPSGAIIEYTYDLAGNRTLTRHVQGSEVTENRYTFDAQHRLESAQEGSGETTVYRYDLAGNLIEEMQGDTLTRYRYDRLNRLVEIHSTVGGATTQRYLYTLDTVGRRTRIEETDANGVRHVTDYGYDDLGRLVSEAVAVAGDVVTTSSYAHDDVGNRTSLTENGETKTATFDVNDRLLSQGDETYSYDANGNQIGKAEASTIVDYTYDDRGRLVEASDSAAGLSVQFDYDPDGNRIARRIAQGGNPAVATRFVLDRSFGLPEVIAEVDAGGTITARYLHGYQLIQQSSVEGTNSVLRYPLRDGLGSTRYLVDEQGSVTDAIRYTPWGEPREREGSTALTHRFAGEAWEESLGLSFNRARWYSPDLARFTSIDPWPGSMFEPQSLSDYAYVQNNPVFYIDPTGWTATNMSEVPLAGAVNAALNSGIQVGFRVVLRKAGNKVICVAVEEAVEFAVFEALTGGVYVLVEAGDLYAGKTGDFDRRLVEHAKTLTRNIERTLARFHFDFDGDDLFGKKGNDLRLLEQFFIEFLRDNEFTLTNKVNAVRESGGSKNTRKLREALSKLDFCK